MSQRYVMLSVVVMALSVLKNGKFRKRHCKWLLKIAMHNAKLCLPYKSYLCQYENVFFSLLWNICNFLFFFVSKMFSPNSQRLIRVVEITKVSLDIYIIEIKPLTDNIFSESNYLSTMLGFVRKIFVFLYEWS